MLHRIRFKLFLAMIGVHALLALATYLVVSWSFGQAFVDYLNRAEQTRLTPLIEALAEGYERHDGWDWIAGDHRSWRRLLYRYLVTGGRPLADDKGLEDRPPPERGEHPLTFDPRLLLLDEQQRVLIGRPHHVEQAVLKPIMRQDKLIGYLGYRPRRGLVESIDRLFADQQNRNFAITAIGMLLAAALLAAGIAQWLGRPIRALAGGTKALTEGRYDIHIEVKGRDELARLARDFNVLAATLDANRRARRQWIADIAHELRTPLSILQGEIEALQDGIRAPDPKNLASLAQEVAQLSRLVDDLHMLSLSDLGALDYHKTPLALGELMEEVIEDHRSALTQAGIALQMQIRNDAKVKADPQRLLQLFGNLLQNTLRYTDAPGRLQVELRRQGDEMLVDWQDSAPGVAERDLPHLTERLYRIEGSRGRAGGGSGLGLAIARAIVEAHGGRMRAYPSPLGGLGWEIALPVHEDDERD